jgi:4a-hydroxytetrahydrobiopterin dehydratase
MNNTNWEEIDGKLCKTFAFKTFVDAFAFMTKVAFIAEKQQHHPNWSNVYNKVTFTLCTHDELDMVTQKDYTLAASIDAVFL